MCKRHLFHDWEMFGRVSGRSVSLMHSVFRHCRRCGKWQYGYVETDEESCYMWRDCEQPPPEILCSIEEGKAARARRRARPWEWGC